MLELKGVKKTYGTQVALHPVDLDFTAGRTVGLIGPSGCGKSTLLRILIGLIIPDCGEVRIDDELLTAASARTLRHRIV